MESLSYSEAVKELFESTLQALSGIDAFCRPTSPVSFIVYAHDSEVEGAGGSAPDPAYADAVKTLIHWFRTVRSKTISDRHPAAFFEFESRTSGTAACRDILDNQLCLLPRRGVTRKPGDSIAIVDAVIVCGSPRLESYRKTPLATEYINVVKEIYNRWPDQPIEDLRQNIQKNALLPYSKVEGFHHILTELAFLELRQMHDSDRSGIILLSLTSQPMDYLQFPEPTNLYLKLDLATVPQVGYNSFFKLLRLLYTEQHAMIECFEKAFRAMVAEVQGGSSEFFRKSDMVKIIASALDKARSDLLDHEEAQLRQIQQTVLARRLEESQFADLEHRSSALLGNLPTIAYKDRKDRNRERVAGTCEWFTNHKIFHAWVNDTTSKLLWVSAYPGCGKSVLMRYLVDYLTVTPENTVCYFFFKDDFEDQTSLTGAIRCLLHQVFLLQPSVLTNEVLKKFEKDKLLLSSPDGLWSVLLETSRRLPYGCIVCVLDGLDECANGDRQSLIAKLVDLEKQQDSATRLKVLVSSRFYRDITRGFHDVRSRIHLSGENETEAQQISAEIDVVIIDRIRDISDRLCLSSTKRRILQTEITKVPQRTYLWAHLILEEVEDAIETDAKSLRMIINDLPRSVDEAYEKILSRSGKPERVKLMLQIIVAARQPLTLLELAEAWAVERSSCLYRCLEIPTEDEMRRTLHNLCGLFAVIVSDKVYLIHQTARDFLVPAEERPQAVFQEAPPWKGAIELHEADRTMAMISSTFLLCPDLPNLSLDANDTALVSGHDSYHGGPLGLEGQYGSGTASYHGDSIARCMHFEAYAALHWLDHAKEIREEEDPDLMFKASELCDPSSERYRQWIRLYNYPRQLSYDQIENLSADEPRFLAIVSAGLPHVAQSHIRRFGAGEVLSKTSEGLTGLHFASKRGDFVMIELLLKHEANVHASDINGRSALHEAVCSREPNIAQLLIDHGIDVNASDNFGKTALHMVAERGCTKTAMLLLNAGAHTEQRNINGETPLAVALHFQRIDCANILWHHGADMSAVYTAKQVLGWDHTDEGLVRRTSRAMVERKDPYPTKDILKIRRGIADR